MTFFIFYAKGFLPDVNLPYGALERGQTLYLRTLVFRWRQYRGQDPAKAGSQQLQAFDAGKLYVPWEDALQPRAATPWAVIVMTELIALGNPNTTCVWPVAAEGEEDSRIHQFTSERLARLVSLLRQATSGEERFMPPQVNDFVPLVLGSRRITPAMLDPREIARQRVAALRPFTPSLAFVRRFA